jgi:tryptophan 6-halogenase
MSDGPRSIVILGGGTAGWMAANLLAHHLGRDVAVTVVESPDIGIIGVGEGSTPQLKAFFDTLGIAEADWMPRCNATYKTGIGFHGWSEAAGFGDYFHPFPTDLDGFTAPAFFANAYARRHRADTWAHPDRFFLPTALAAQRLAPIVPTSFPFQIGYGYHFDAHLVGAFLRDHAIGLGVRYLQHRVVDVAVTDGIVTHLLAEEDVSIGGNFFVDCSGFRSVIAQGALGVPFLPFASNLFNDSAVVMPTPRDPGGTNCHTISTAMRHGWAWDIPLTSRTGNGYVYSSGYASTDEAETELRAHLGLLDAPVEARHLKMKVGRVAESWAGNCLALGLAQGFIEPLEATALHIVQATVEGFLRAWRDGGYTPQHRAGFNRMIAARYEGIRDYIVCHYRMNRRTDTTYWRDNAANHALSDSLKAIISCWFTGRDLEEEIMRQDIAHYYAPASWHCLLAGYGQFPDATQIDPAAPRPPTDMAAIDDFIARCALNFPSHDIALGALGAA